jgi:MFS transporter, FSR family, fosmidomycin resistance protein
MTTLDGFFAVEHAPRSGRLCDFSSTGSFAVLTLYGTAHVVVDAICAAIVFGILATQAVPTDTFVALLVLYHAFAFGTQTIFGLIVDRIGTPRLSAALGCLLTASALLFGSSPMLAVVLAGLGNAAFHVGGGVISLRLTPHRATAPGIFVAPGSLGLMLGAVLGKSGHLPVEPFLLTALLLACLIAWVPVRGAERPTPAHRLANRGDLILGGLLLAIGIRGLLGLLVTFSWETQPVSLLLLTLAAVLGKAAGGILADRWGWLRVGAGATLAALPFLALGSTHPLLAIPGILLLNLAMPATLAATSETLPDHPGFAFGLTCLALFFGMLPSLLGIPLNSPAVVCLAILLSTAALYRGLRPQSLDSSFHDTAEVRI